MIFIVMTILRTYFYVFVFIFITEIVFSHTVSLWSILAWCEPSNDRIYTDQLCWSLENIQHFLGHFLKLEGKGCQELDYFKILNYLMRTEDFKKEKKNQLTCVFVRLAMSWAKPISCINFFFFSVWFTSSLILTLYSI